MDVKNDSLNLGYYLHTRYYNRHSRYDMIIIENKYGEIMCQGSVDFLSRILSKYVLKSEVINHSKEVIKINYI